MHNNSYFKVKKTVLLSAFLLIAVACHAIPAKKGVRKAIQLDSGEVVEATLKGDEHLHYWQAADGRCFLAYDGSYHETSLEEQSRRLLPRRARISKSRQSRIKRAQTENNAYVGEKKGLIILTQFANKKFRSGHNKTLYQRITNEAGYSSNVGFVGSVNDYFKAQSNGLFDLTFDIVGPVTVANNYSYYGKNDRNGTDKNVEALVTEAVKLATDSFS